MEAYNKEIFAKNLSFYMNRNGEEPKDICDLLSVGKSTVSSWLNAKKVPRMDKIETLAVHYDILKSDLLEENTLTPKFEHEPEPGETHLINLYHELNSEGRELLVDYADTLVTSQKYIKTSTSELDKKQA